MKKVTLTKNDYTRIYKAITDAKNSKTINSNEAEKLLSELSKAEIVPSEKIDKDVVTMNSEVKLFFENTQKEQSFKIVYPQDANLKENKISIFSPIATALIGYKIGDEIEWIVPGGKTKIKIVDLIYQPEAAGDFDL
ncbi:nucleoside diphosphate kinase regulator [Cloacibacterium normanense]|uniref:Nucleoside diphosphate kinase regulator n=1 Tax=Cloacibacterium normanense TaxID=237258 RepID=A0A2S7I8P8_9FLAO|nr:nucleoside diphosphate kinase regulator [Cloacibacterium normanense]PPZ92941.1 nucleoside diphosphate kinase regulator [Cloacibacterium normanense]